MEYLWIRKDIVYCIMMQIEIMIEFEVSFNGKGQGAEYSSSGSEIESIKEIGPMSVFMD